MVTHTPQLALPPVPTLTLASAAMHTTVSVWLPTATLVWRTSKTARVSPREEQVTNTTAVTNTRCDAGATMHPSGVMVGTTRTTTAPPTATRATRAMRATTGRAVRDHIVDLAAGGPVRRVTMVEADMATEGSEMLRRCQAVEAGRHATGTRTPPLMLRDTTTTGSTIADANTDAGVATITFMTMTTNVKNAGATDAVCVVWPKQRPSSRSPAVGRRLASGQVTTHNSTAALDGRAATATQSVVWTRMAPVAVTVAVATKVMTMTLPLRCHLAGTAVHALSTVARTVAAPSTSTSTLTCLMMCELSRRMQRHSDRGARAAHRSTNTLEHGVNVISANVVGAAVVVVDGRVIVMKAVMAPNATVVAATVSTVTATDRGHLTTTPNPPTMAAMRMRTQQAMNLSVLMIIMALVVSTGLLVTAMSRHRQMTPGPKKSHGHKQCNKRVKAPVLVWTWRMMALPRHKLTVSPFCLPVATSLGMGMGMMVWMGQERMQRSTHRRSHKLLSHRPPPHPLRPGTPPTCLSIPHPPLCTATGHTSRGSGRTWAQLLTTRRGRRDRKPTSTKAKTPVWRQTPSLGLRHAIDGAGAGTIVLRMALGKSLRTAMSVSGRRVEMATMAMAMATTVWMSMLMAVAGMKTPLRSAIRPGTSAIAADDTRNGVERRRSIGTISADAVLEHVRNKNVT